MSSITIDAPDRSYDLPGGAILRVYDGARYAETCWPDGLVCGATREPTPDNCAQAAEQGYSSDADGCWRSLVEHEWLHSVVSDTLFGTPSPALRHEAGVPHALHQRYYEEAVALAVQRYANTGERPAALDAIPLGLLQAWTRALAAAAPAGPVYACA